MIIHCRRFSKITDRAICNMLYKFDLEIKDVIMDKQEVSRLKEAIQKEQKELSRLMEANEKKRIEDT